MATKPVGLSEPVKPLSVACSEDLIDKIQQFIKNEKKLSVEESQVAANDLIAQLNRLAKEDNLAGARQGFCLLLATSIESIQRKVIANLKPLLHLRYLANDAKSNQIPYFLILENSLSNALNSCSSAEASAALIDLYQDLLERLWLLPYLVGDPSYICIVQNKGEEIKNVAKAWLERLAKELESNKQTKFLLKDVTKALERVYQPSPEVVREQIEAIKEQLAAIRIPGLVGEICLYVGDTRRAINHFQESLRWLNSPHFPKLADLQYRDITENALYNRMGEAYLSQNEPSKAIPCYNQCLEIAQKLHDCELQAEAYMSLGIAYKKAGEYETSIQSHLRCIEIAQSLANEELVQKAYANLAQTYYSQGTNYQQGIVYLHKRLAIIEDQDDLEEARLYAALGDAYLATEAYPEATGAYTKCLTISINIGFFPGLALAHAGLGSVSMSQDKYPAARESFKNLLESARIVGDRLEEAKAQNAIGNTYIEEGEYQLALACYEQALKIPLDEEDLIESAKAYSGLSGLYTQLGQYTKALEYAKQYKKIAEEQNNDAELSTAYINLGNIYHSLGDNLKAIDKCKLGVKIAIDLKDKRVTAGGYIHLGNAYFSNKNYDDAFICYRESLRLARDLGSVWQEGIAQGSLGMAYLGIQDYDNALEPLKLYLQLASDSQDLPGQERANANLGIVHYYKKQHKEAIGYYEKQRDIARNLGHRFGEAVALNNLGFCYLAFDDFENSEKEFRFSIELFSNLQSELGDSNQWKITIFENQVQAYIGLERVLHRREKPDEALLVSDSRRSRALVSALSKKVPSLSAQPEEFKSVEEIKKLAGDLKTTFVVYSLGSLSEKGLGAWIVPSEGEIIWKPLPFNKLSDEMKEASKIFQSYPFINLPPPTRPPRQSKLLKTNRGEGDLLSMPLSRPLPVLKEMQALTRGGPASSQEVAILKGQLSKWHEVFIEDIEDFLPKNPQQTVTIIPDSFLAQLPFAALQGKNGDYLIDKHAISIAPSIRSLQLLRQLPRNASMTSLVIGNPTTPNPTFNNLGEPKEAQDIVAPLLKTPPEKVLVGLDSTVRRFLKEAPQAGLIHLVCHGETGDKLEEKPDPYSVFEGFFRLAGDPEHKNGYLYALEIASLSLRAELTFMSSCFSGRGKIQREGVIGPVYSFLGAGSRSTVSTYWPLPNTPLTLAMVKIFYRHLLGDGEAKLNKAQALQQAIKFAKKEDPENISQWAAFFLSGLSE
ncbi:MAG: tetratricopeptide repeat protein [Verrucomicrobia bacterium]|nr:tetratricopeptide repeat protein [Verrucomicrobiota bacterium]